MGIALAAKLEVKALQLSSRYVTELVLVTAARNCSALCGANLKDRSRASGSENTNLYDGCSITSC